MVKFDKSVIPIPAILQNDGRGGVATRDLIANYEAGNKIFEFDAGIYGHTTVKSALVELQHGKCCFCESTLRHISSGDVEHFRPKAGFQSALDSPMIRPGYYWLVYDFSNLYLSCEICNRSFKKNFFPLSDETRRVRSHHQHLQINNEGALIIDPAEDEPSEHIEFDREIPKPKGEKGRITIERTGLDRFDLNQERLEYYEFMAFIAAKARSGDVEAVQIIRKAAYPSQRYSLMIRCNFADLLA